MTWEKFWSIIDRVRAQADMQDEASVNQFLYTELIKLPQDELLGFDCVWQSYRNKANFPKMVAAACIINDGSSDDRFTDFRNWLIMQGYDAYRQALIDPDNLAVLNIPFRDTEWMGCGNVAWYAYAGQKLRTYFEKAGIAAELHRRYPTLLKLPDDLHRAIMQEQLAPHRAQETEWERQMLRTEVKHYIEVSDLAYSYNKFYAQNMPDKVAWETLQSDLFANLPQIKAERMPQAISVAVTNFSPLIEQTPFCTASKERRQSAYSMLCASGRCSRSPENSVMSTSSISCIFFLPAVEKQHTAGLIPIAILYLMKAIG